MTPDHGLWQDNFIPGDGSNVFVARLCDEEWKAGRSFS
jgi:hypothetical protein